MFPPLWRCVFTCLLSFGSQTSVNYDAAELWTRWLTVTSLVMIQRGCVCACVFVCVAIYAVEFYISLNPILPCMAAVTWDACLLCVLGSLKFLYGGGDAALPLALPSSTLPLPAASLATVWLVLTGSLRHQSARWWEGEGGPPTCYWLPSSWQGARSQSPAPSCRLCPCFFSFFFNLQ